MTERRTPRIDVDIHSDVAVTVTCNAESHAERPFTWTYCRYQHPTAGPLWLERTRVPSQFRNGYANSQKVIDADNRAVGLEAPVPPGETRKRYTLKCSWCGDKLDACGDHVHHVFDTLAAAGVDRISLSALAARVVN